ncbi:MAG: helix-turn-helix transcriptional regulator [Candidatus Eisenbacteria bacterium]|nr:helix-turn-helix transcriptional regulator [Candidatus Eisenbacteria bacterium]
MLDKAELGRRVKLERLAKGMTLKQVADASGMSPTHISEIERGRTSPTVGALLRIAHALGKSATFFVEEDELPTVSIVRRHERAHRTITKGGQNVADVDFLTRGIPAGRLRVVQVQDFESGKIEGPTHQGEEILLVMSGKIRVTVGTDSYDLEDGDSIQFKGSVAHTFERVGVESPRAFWITASEGLLSP